MLLSDFPTNPSPAREVTSLAIKVVNDAGSPGDSAIGPNGDFCSLFDVKEDEQDAFGYKDGNNGWVTCAFTEPRQAGVYNISMVSTANMGGRAPRASLSFQPPHLVAPVFATILLPQVQDGDLGEARVLEDALRATADGKAYMMSWAPKVTNVSPKAGSLAGGTVCSCGCFWLCPFGCQLDSLTLSLPTPIPRNSPLPVRALRSTSRSSRSASAALLAWSPLLP